MISNRNENIGEVDDLLIRRNTLNIGAVFSVGGFLGIGERLVAVPYEELRISLDGDKLYYDATRETLKAIVEFEYGNNKQWATAVRGAPEGGLMGQLGIDKDDQGIDWNKLDKNWDEFKNTASDKWTELTPSDWQDIEDNRTIALGVISSRTGTSKGQLELELSQIVDSL